MTKEIENCYDVALLKEKIRKKEDLIHKSNMFISECDLRINQLRYEQKNQIRLEGC